MTSSLAESLKAEIEKEILAFNFKPGDRLDECRLADLYGSSRTPVREALRLLAAEGLVRIRPHRGAVVSGLTMAELMDMFQMMSVYEGVCARLAAMQISESELYALEAAHDACRVARNADNLQDYCVANARFHELIYYTSKNRYLIERTIAMRNRLGAYRRFRSKENVRLQDAFAEHEGIVEAIRKREPDEADHLMRAHMTNQSAQLTAIIGRLPQDYFADGAVTAPRSQASMREPVESYPAAALAFE